MVSAIIDEKFKAKNLIYLCLKFKEYFHTEPESIETLLDGMDYIAVQSSIKELLETNALIESLNNKR